MPITTTTASTNTTSSLAGNATTASTSESPGGCMTEKGNSCQFPFKDGEIKIIFLLLKSEKVWSLSLLGFNQVWFWLV